MIPPTSRRGGEGAEVIYALRNNGMLASSILNELKKEGQIPRKYYQRRLPSDSSKDYYYIIRNTPNNETVIVEYGFLDNAKDAAKLKVNYKKYAEAVVRAVAEYGGYNYNVIPGSGYYIVKSGDTLWSIARNYGLTVDELKRLNNLTSNNLTIGMSLLVNKNNIDNNDNGNNNEELEAYEYYTVKSGDTLYSIANKYNLTVDELKNYNNLSSNNLSINQKLIIGEKALGNVYKVQRGDTLYSIARQFNISVDDLRNVNNLGSNTLSIGQILVIPDKKEGQNTFIYEVKKGDTLYNLASTYKTTVSRIKELNNLNSNVLSIGQKLIIPN